MPLLHSLVLLHGATPHFSFPAGALANEQIVLRWVHFVLGIIWIGLLYFFNLVGFRTMRQLDSSVRSKVFPVLMTRAMWWFRWSGLVTVLAGLRYFWQILLADARNSGNPARASHWFGGWLLVWIAAYVLIYLLQLPSKTIFNSTWIRGIAIGIVVVAASWVVLELNASPSSSNSHLSISVGGGLGLVMLLNAWGVVWRAQEKLIAWTRASAKQGTPMPTEAERLARWAFIASRVAFWLSFPMLFFMGAADHYPFLSSIAD